MRLTSIAVILQSASFFVSTFAVITADHIWEGNKGFNCDGREIFHDEYNRAEKSQISGSVNSIGSTMINVYQSLLSDQEDDRTVAFQGPHDGVNRFFELRRLSQKQQIYGGFFYYSYILVTNQNKNANAMIKRSIYYTNNQLIEPKPEGLYTICEISI
ncbi:BgTH12-02771 [Blumeria graminis f. sp. triticale]|uniref:Bgt-51992 n=2 Tax=Blumeria graminis TaxID=34373 RepID=A0A9X9QDF7_BLUGR|nr:BgTH12-02771 [Blumeria graminis f. sp. triticale]VDB89043.1 Bgt-51992 [Blumeria graminis f. sp. tritici]